MMNPSKYADIYADADLLRLLFKMLAMISYAFLGVILLLYETDGDPSAVAMGLFAYAYGIGSVALVYVLRED